jgi:hypothetical protein
MVQEEQEELLGTPAMLVSWVVVEEEVVTRVIQITIHHQIQEFVLSVVVGVQEEQERHVFLFLAVLVL